MKKYILIAVVSILAACGGSSENESSNGTTPPTTQGGGQPDEKLVMGKKLFDSKCSSCHALNKKLIGPALGGIGQRRTAEWLRAYIRNNNEVRNSGDSIAMAVYEEYNKIPMTTFPDLTDKEIDAIVYYCDTPIH